MLNTCFKSKLYKYVCYFVGLKFIDILLQFFFFFFLGNHINLENLQTNLDKNTHGF